MDVHLVEGFGACQMPWSGLLFLLVIIARWCGCRTAGINKLEYHVPAFNRTLRITTIEVEPYVMPVYSHANGTTHIKHEGFIMDLILKLSRMLKFNYVASVNRDGQYGHRRPDGTWDGLIGDVLYKRADFAASPMFITEFRQRVVDFSVPFLDVQATLLLRKSPVGVPLPIQSVEDLLTQSEIKYGTLSTGLITRSFRHSNDSVSTFLWRNMLRFQPDIFTDTNEEGIAKVRAEKYAFILPTTIGEYIAERAPCDLTTLGAFLMDRGYGLSFPKHSAYRRSIDSALTELRKNGYLADLYRKWWYGRSECRTTESASSYIGANNSVTLLLAPSILLAICNIFVGLHLTAMTSSGCLGFAYT